MSGPCAEGRRILDRAWDLATPLKYAPGLPNTARALIQLGCPVDDCLRVDVSTLDAFQHVQDRANAGTAERGSGV